MSNRQRTLIPLFLVAAVLQADQPYVSHKFAGSDSIGDGGPAIQAVLRQTEGLASDISGNVYLADANDHRIRRISPDGSIQTVAGTGVAGYKGDGGLASQAQLNSPYGLALDGNGNLYVADLGNGVVRRIGADGIIQTIAGGGTLSPSAITPATRATDLQLNAPRNIVTDPSGTTYFSDFGLHQVFMINPIGVISVAAGAGKSGSGGDGGPATAAGLSYPSGLTIDSIGALYIADSGNGRVRKVVKGVITSLSAPQPPFNLPTGLVFDSTGALLVADGNRAQVARLAPDGTWSNLAIPALDVTVDPAGSLYFSKGPFVLKLGKDGQLATIAGSGTGGYVGENIPALSARLQNPIGMAMDLAGNLYFADSSNHRVRKISVSGVVSTVAGTGDKGYSGDGALGLAARLNSPTGVAVDAAGNVYFTDTGNHAVRKVDASGFISTIAGTGGSGYTGDAGPAVSAQLNGPTAITLDGSGNPVFADTGNHAIRRFTPGGIIQTISGGNGAGFSGDGKPAIFGQLNAPEGLAYDKSGNLWIGDTQNQQIRQVDYRGTIRTIGYMGPFQWKLPRGLATNDAGDIFVADGGRYQLIRLASDGTTTPIAGTGQQGSSDAEGAALDLPLSNPIALVVGPSGEVYLADAGANRIRKLQKDTLSGPATSVTALNGASYLSQSVAPGEILALFGTNVGSASPQSGSLGSKGLFSTTLGGVQVLFDNIAAPLFYAQSNQINLQTPFEVQGRKLTQVQILRDQRVVSSFGLLVADAAPGVFADRDTGQCLLQNQDGSINGATNPAPRNSIVTFYATGDGQTDIAGVTGKPIGLPYPQPKLPVSVQIGGVPAPILFAGEAPGMVGVIQLNVRIPTTVAAGSTVPLTLQVGSAQSQPGVHLALR